MSVFAGAENICAAGDPPTSSGGLLPPNPRREVLIARLDQLQRSLISSSNWKACRMGCMTVCSNIESIQ
jgi:hypothetical protein